MLDCKMQFCCGLILLYLGLVYRKECSTYHLNWRKTFYYKLWLVGCIATFFDGVTAYTVNRLESVPFQLNFVLHAIFLVSLDGVMYLLFSYIISLTETKRHLAIQKKVCQTVFFINTIFIILTMPYLDYRQGTITNYSMGLPVYACFVMAMAYIVLTLGVLVRHWNHIVERKRMGILTYLLVLIAITVVQMRYPQVLLSACAITILLVGVYVNLEAPSFQEISRYHNESIMAFATLIESRDSSTGGHIRRTSKYVELICKELILEKYYQKELTKDFVEQLVKAAPMHDIGKIAIPDHILQKPGKLTEEEFEVMKSHSSAGGKIVLETFKELGTDEYRQMAYEVARYHHEKWNGRGYPEGKEGQEIPLAARIMAVADVFDAVSEKRCYRDAMPLEKCFGIIREGIGTDFDPVIARAFLNIEEDVRKIHHDFEENS